MLSASTGSTSRKRKTAIAEPVPKSKPLKDVRHIASAITFAFAWVEPRYFAPLLETSVGNLVIGLAGFFWILAFVTARRILAVDL